MKESELDFRSQVELLKPHSTEAIVLRFNFDDFNLDEADDLFNHVKSVFPNNTVIAIPAYASLQSCSKDSLENIISMISEIIGGL